MSATGTMLRAPEGPIQETPDGGLDPRMEARLAHKRDAAREALRSEIARLSRLVDAVTRVDPEVLLAANDCFASTEEAVVWLTRPSPEFAWRTPLEAAGTTEGKERLLSILLGRIDGP